ncbi:Early activation antigen CD69 [Nibea albiflora]|uniref:Early activation antigen CD69 n=1 Tax=Nibea albiflora TaxID=240163 RepID=A0ACB7F6V4_NIBAL|nr:Early activation antigen CD69 [Nibea albiflora]
MEMQAIATEGANKRRDVEPMLDEQPAVLKDADPFPYSKLHRPSEDVYAQPSLCDVTKAVQNRPTDCPMSEKIGSEEKQALVASTCSYSQCQDYVSRSVAPYRECKQCADGWLTFGRSCFFMSTTRLSWEQSQKNCTTRGGSLAVISSQEIQNFLTQKGKMKYWIGLRKTNQESDTWTWVNNTVPQTSYWAEDPQQGDCGIINSDNPGQRNWVRAPCSSYTYFICQLQM